MYATIDVRGRGRRWSAYQKQPAIRQRKVKKKKATTQPKPNPLREKYTTQKHKRDVKKMEKKEEKTIDSRTKKKGKTRRVYISKKDH